jgi:TPR repeat protein
MGIFHDKGLGVQRDEPEAIRKDSLSAAQGHAQAQAISV